MEKRGHTDLIILLIVCLIALAVLLLSFGVISPSGKFVYAGNRVQLEPAEGCASVACREGQGLVVNVRNTKFWQGPPQVADCVCPEDVTSWQADNPRSYPESAVKTVRLIKNYNEYTRVKYE
ncbi:MAG: hypothetical protein HY363_02055 [Candidatus Aenigmarchaeota archaeon]|nr:hypothetical protein [Candidatus Aenigmarchaeota archaeon]